MRKKTIHKSKRYKKNKQSKRYKKNKYSFKKDDIYGGSLLLNSLSTDSSVDIDIDIDEDTGSESNLNGFKTFIQKINKKGKGNISLLTDSELSKLNFFLSKKEIIEYINFTLMKN